MHWFFRLVPLSLLQSKIKAIWRPSGKQHQRFSKDPPYWKVTMLIATKTPIGFDFSSQIAHQVSKCYVGPAVVGNNLTSSSWRKSFIKLLVLKLHINRPRHQISSTLQKIWEKRMMPFSNRVIWATC